jgi:hypothetical protein
MYEFLSILNFTHEVHVGYLLPGNEFLASCKRWLIKISNVILSRWFPNAAARVRARVWSCGICGGQSGAGAGFLRVLRFPLPIFVPPIAPQSPSSIIWGLYNRPEVDLVPPH